MSMTGHYLRVSPQTITRIQGVPSSLIEVLHPDPEPDDYAARHLDIDKTWHVIHFLLNADAWHGEIEAVLGGELLTDEDLGYGQARYLTPERVAATSDALQRISPEALWSRYDDTRARAADLYWSNEPDSKEYALENYRSLREFFATAAKGREAVILWLA